jgi:glycosyltransferase involved in cell wall biosynthesis
VQSGVVGDMSKPMRIGLVMQGGTNWIGGIEYIKNIVFALSTLPPVVKAKFEIYLICDPDLDADLYRSILAHVQGVFYLESNHVLTKIKSTIQRILSQENYPRVARFLRQNKATDIDFLYPYFSLKSNPCSSAAWIPDFQHKYLPANFTAIDIIERDQLFQRFAKHAPQIVVSSESAKSDLFKFFPDSLNKQVQVLSFAAFPLASWYIDNPEEITEKYDLPAKYFLVSNQFWQHKNHDVVFRAMKILRDRDIQINIVFTGKLDDFRDPQYIQNIYKIIDEFQLAPQVHLLGLIPKIDQVQLIRTCLAMIQPSLFEGWSTVVEDARCFGKRIALSDLPVHLEQNPPAALFFARSDPAQLAEILEQWWHQLEPGVNLPGEAIARANNYLRIQSFADQFLTIAGIDLVSTC